MAISVEEVLGRIVALTRELVANAKSTNTRISQLEKRVDDMASNLRSEQGKGRG